MTFALAPLAGFTDAPFRRLAFEGGADLTYTEMVSAAGLAHGSSPTRHLMEKMSGEGPLAVQFFGSKETDIYHAVSSLTDDERARFVEVNLNAGCPMTKVTREGAGAKLIEDPEKIYRLLKAMCEATDLPVSLKTRLGPHPRTQAIFEILDAAERAGAKKLIVHARYTSQMHGGEVHLDVLEEVVKRAKIPVVGNGSIVDRKTLKAFEATGIAGVMIGRAALSDSTIFARLKGEEISEIPLFDRHLEYVLAFRDQLAAAYPNDHVPSRDAFASVKMHTHLFRYFNGRPGAAALRARLNQVRTLKEIYDCLDSQSLR